MTDDLDMFDGTFNLPVSSERTWGSLAHFLAGVDETLKLLEPGDRAAYDNEAAEFASLLRKVGIDPADPAMVHAFAWGIYLLLLLNQTMLEQHACPDKNHVWAHMLPPAVRAGALIQAMRKAAGA